MVSTRQMTGATSDESNLHLYRVLPTTTSTPSSPSLTASASYSNVGGNISSNCNKTLVASQNINQSSLVPSVGVTVSFLSPSSCSNFTDPPLNVTVPSLSIAKNLLQKQQHNCQEINLMDLPTELLEHIFSFLGYKKIGHMRVLSRQVNHVCSSILNSTFQKLQNQMHTRFQNVKAKMPRRESARRNHPLACECDILETCYMRLSLLQMTFGKHIERKHCCFFPGGILDEVYSVLNYIRTSPALDRPYKVTDELFDLSTMAMEYFKEHIEPNLPDIAYFTSSTKSFTALETSSSILSRDTSHSNSSSPPQSNMVLRKGIRKIKQGMKRYNNQLSVLRSELRTCKRKATEQTKTITEHQKLLAEQQKQTLEFANRLDETDKKNDELSRKFSTVLQELNKCKTELQYWRSKSPATTNCNPHGQFFLPHELQALGSQPVTSDDIEVFSNCISRSGFTAYTNAEGNRKKEEFEQSNKTTENKSQTVIAEAESLVVIDSTETSAISLAKPMLKRKLDSLQMTTGNCVHSSNTCDNGLLFLNPPYASASLVASYSSTSSSASANTSMLSSVLSDVSQLTSSRASSKKKDENETHNVEKAASFTADVKDVTKDTQHFINTTSSECSSVQSMLLDSSKSLCNTIKVIGIPPTNQDLKQSSSNCNSSGFTRNIDRKNDSTSSNDHNKKLRRVQNNARSQSNSKHYNNCTASNMHRKPTRSKQLDKQVVN